MLLHTDIVQRLTAMSGHGDIPHLLFHGPRGSGKLSLVKHLLEKLYGAGANRMSSEKHVVNTNTAKSIDVDVRVSNYHIEIQPSDAGVNDTFVVQYAIKEMANNGSIASMLMNSGITHKTIVITKAGNLSKQAQAGLRRTMELYSSSCRLILTSVHASRVIEPLRSRCVLIRVPLPHPADLKELVGTKVGDDELANKIVQNSGRSISRAMYMAEQGNAEKMVWMKYIDSIGSSVFLEQSPRNLLDVRDSLAELLGAGVPASLILSTLLHSLLKHDALKDQDAEKKDIVKLAAMYEHRICIGSKPLLHLEAFVATVMHVHKKRLVEMFV